VTTVISTQSQQNQSEADSSQTASSLQTSSE